MAGRESPDLAARSNLSRARARRLVVSTLGCFAVAAIYMVDRGLRPELAATNAYLLPIGAVAWFAGMRLGLVVAAVATLMSVAASGPTVGVVEVSMAAILGGTVAWTLASLRVSHDRERRLARTDAATGAPNRRSFEEGARLILRQHGRSRRPFTAVGIDLDGFKAVNDTLGHDEGDEVLRVVARTLARSVRGTDIVARYGGDEFAVIFVDTDEQGATALLARLRHRLDDAMLVRRWPVTFSVGAITFHHLPRSERELMKRVDEQMYAAKRGGKDRLVHAVVRVAVA